MLTKQLEDAKSTLKQKEKVAENSASAQLKKQLKKAKADKERLQGKQDMLENDEKIAAAYVVFWTDAGHAAKPKCEAPVSEPREHKISSALHGGCAQASRR